jgi:energy-coupling factor transporter ATP-binding protein EcfA2
MIALSDKYEIKEDIEYPIDMQKVKKLKLPLMELKLLIGLEDIKRQVVDQVMFLLSNLKDADQMLHTVIYGSPGSGKTNFALILSKIYAALGFSNGSTKIVKRADLVAGYLGQTAIKTQKVIDEAKGGVLFIDEAYSLGNKEGRDMFSKEAIDTLNANLTERKTEFICIIAGYKKELDECFFSVNPGLGRRFPFRYHIREYDYKQLHGIFLCKVFQSGWTIDTIPYGMFEDNEKEFVYKGGDMETLSQLSKIAYTRRIFGKFQDPAKHLTLADVQAGMKMFLENDEIKRRKEENAKDQDMIDRLYH